MSRQPRLDAPGTLHHVMGRGIERKKIFRNEEDRLDFVQRLAALCQEGYLYIYAWALMPNHFHLLVRTGRQTLSKNMKKLLTGYVVNFNRRHKRYGHLFQNRYKSIICEEDPYLLELTRYIHLNPLRARIVKSIKGLNRYAWTGHSAIMGKTARKWQDVDEVLSYFGTRRKKAVSGYKNFVSEGIGMGRRPELVGGGLIRSTGGWSQVLSLRRKGMKSASDERILGSSDFVEEILCEAEQREIVTLRLSSKMKDLESLEREIIKREGVKRYELRSGSRKPTAVKARTLFCQIAVKKMGYIGAEVARYLGTTTSTVNRRASCKELPEVASHIKGIGL